MFVRTDNGVTVKRPDGLTFPIPVQVSDTVLTLKHAIRDLGGCFNLLLPPLSFGRTLLDDCCQLSDYGIENGSRVTVGEVTMSLQLCLVSFQRSVSLLCSCSNAIGHHVAITQWRTVFHNSKGLPYSWRNS